MPVHSVSCQRSRRSSCRQFEANSVTYRKRELHSMKQKQHCSPLSRSHG